MSSSTSGSASQVFSIGHSTHELGGFVGLLREHQLAALADIRRWPKSRRFPHFDAERLGPELTAAGVAYRHFAALGGWRKARLDPSPNDGWRSAGFAAYADYLLTPAGRSALAELVEWGGERQWAFMCAEATHRRCHRQLVADWLLARGFEVHHIAPDGSLAPHALSPHGCIGDEGTVTYPATPFPI